MTDDRPLVSAIVTSYNHERYLRRALESALAQQVEGLEVIAIDDASTDGSRRILEEVAGAPRLRIELHPENRGVSRVFNRGLELARGTWVAYLGSDDFWLPGHLSGALDALRGGDLALCYGRVRVVDGDERDVAGGEPMFGSAPDADFFAELLRRSNFVPFISAVVRRDAALDCGGFDDRLGVLQDYDLWLRIAVNHPVRFLDRTSAAFRWDGRNTSRRSAENSVSLRRELASILERWLTKRGGDLRRVGAESAVRSRLAATYRRLGRRVAPAEAARCYRRSLELEPRRVSALGGYFLSSLRSALSMGESREQS
jgi:glycosyltransferase involved in cell wall biosynthesis